MSIYEIKNFMDIRRRQIHLEFKQEKVFRKPHNQRFGRAPFM